MSGLGHTARGVLGSVSVLAIIAGAAAWVFERADVPHRSGPPAESPAPRTAAATSPTAPAAAPTTGGVIRVALTRRPARSVALKIDGPFRVVPLTPAGQAEPFDGPLTDPAVTAGPDGIEIGGIRLGDEIEIVPQRSPSVWIDDRQYRGAVRLHATPEGRLWPVNVLPLEEYLAAVVDSEMPAAFPPAARQAQAVVARTYAVSCRRDPPHRCFDLYATPVSQNYLGYAYRDGGRLLAGETGSGRAAVAATAGLVCTYQGRLFRTFYSACCGGRTVSGQAVFGDATPTLRGVDCPGCGDAPLFRWERSADDPNALDRLAGLARSHSPAFGDLRTARTDAGSRTALAAIRLSDGRRTVRLGPAEIKSALDLPSLDFDLAGNSDRLTARGRGHGHGVGLCQWGAKGLAELGYSSERILKHYYPGCEVVRMR